MPAGAPDVSTAGASSETVLDVAARLGVAMGRLTRALRRVDKVGVGPGSLSALATLVRSGPMRLGDLAAREGVAPPTLTRIVSALEEASLVVRRPDPDDRRAALVAATPAGEDVITGVGSARNRELAARLSRLPSADLDVVTRAVAVLETLAEDA